MDSKPWNGSKAATNNEKAKGKRKMEDPVDAALKNLPARKKNMTSKASKSGSTGMHQGRMKRPLPTARNLYDRAQRRKKKDEEEQRSYYSYVLISIARGYNLNEVDSRAIDAMEQDLKQCSIHNEILKSLNNIRKMAKENQRDPSKEIHIMPEVEKAERAIENLDDMPKKEKKFRQEVFFNQGVSNADKLQEFRKEFPWISDRETATSRPTAQGIGSSQTGEQYSTINGEDSCENATDGPAAATGEHVTVEYVEDFIKKLFAKDNNNVELSTFPGLKEAVDNLEIEHLRPICSNIKKVCGKKYDEREVFNSIFLVCAAIKEMEDLQGLEQANESILLKCGAVFNKAEELGFPMDFAKQRLKEIAQILLRCAG